jgi:signal transduction histidine kinase
MLEEDLPDLTLEETQKIAGSMRNSAIKQFHLLENLLEWSRMQRGLSFFKPEPHKLLDEIAASIELVLDAAEIKNIRIQYDIPEDLTVLADAQMLESIMRNLVFNAVKFTPNGGQITIAAKENAAHTVEISVSDTGIGMDQTIIDKLFSLNDQANRKGTNGEPSTGLGLMICKDYIEKLGDKLSVESAVGKGSTFWFSLPVDKTLKKG